MQLRNVWGAQISLHGEKGPTCINVFDGLAKMTMDVIGLAGEYRYCVLTAVA